jgi:hypothetical protein
MAMFGTAIQGLPMLFLPVFVDFPLLFYLGVAELPCGLGKPPMCRR